MQTQEIQIKVEDDRTGLNIETLKRALADNLFYIQGKFPQIATKNEIIYEINHRFLEQVRMKYIGGVE